MWIALLLACTPSVPSVVTPEETGAPLQSTADTADQAEVLPPDLPGLLVPPASLWSESAVCWFLSASNNTRRTKLYAIGMDTGTIEETARFPGINLYTAGMTYDGESKLLVPAETPTGKMWFVIDLAAGTIEGGIVPTQMANSVSYDNGKFYAEAGTWEFNEYSDIDSVLANTPSRRLTWVSGISRLTVEDGILFNAWHSTGEVLKYDVETSELLDTIPLQGFNTWVWGIGRANGLTHLMDDGRGSSAPIVRIVSFDDSGNKVQTLLLEEIWPREQPSGLYCQTL